jgi:hypothetical protein
VRIHQVPLMPKDLVALINAAKGNGKGA